LKRLLLASLLLVACRQIAGIKPITYSGADGGTGCSNGTVVLSSSNSLDLLTVAGGYDIVAVPDTTAIGYSGLHACATSTPCTEPPGLLTLGFNDIVTDYAASPTQIVYAVETNQTTGTGAIHSVSFDGTNDKTLLASASYPLWITTTAASTFWVSDDGASASLHCIGCGGNMNDQTWMSNPNLTATLGTFSDASTVYVIADDGTAAGTYGVYTCSATTACGTNGKLLAKGFQFAAINIKSEVVSDGTNVYVTNESSAIASITPAGVQTSIVKGVATSAIAVDGATGEIFYGTDNGTVAKAKTDGSGTPTTLSSCDPGSANDILGIALDATNVYVVLAPTTGNSAVWQIKRN
jgi:hypothetical protein